MALLRPLFVVNPNRGEAKFTENCFEGKSVRLESAPQVPLQWDAPQAKEVLKSRLAGRSSNEVVTKSHAP